MNKNSNPPLNMSEDSRRHGYILHLWNSRSNWRASLESLETGQRRGFESLEQLFIHLMDLTEGRSDAEDRQNKRADPS